ncbi:MAG: 30S ribosome-binding factor RbfA [Gammaproteobacteria bacterium]
MRRSHHRPQRVADLIQQELAELLRKARDPRFVAVTVTAVEISNDLANAKVYITLLDETRLEETLQALNHAEGFFRHLLADKVDLRITPHLRFFYDESISRGDKVARLINAALRHKPPLKGE